MLFTLHGQDAEHAHILVMDDYVRANFCRADSFEDRLSFFHTSPTEVLPQLFQVS